MPLKTGSLASRCLREIPRLMSFSLKTIYQITAISLMAIVFCFYMFYLNLAFKKLKTSKAVIPEEKL